MKLTLKILKDHYAICKLPPDSGTPDWIKISEFASITRTVEELSVVCRQSLLPPDVEDLSTNWRIFKICDSLDFTMVGIIAGISDIMKNENIPVFVVSTFNTDYIMVKNKNLEKAKTALMLQGYKIRQV